MIVNPKFRGFICTTAHPEGCKLNVEKQIDYVKSHGKIKGPKNALIIGASAGYGLASRIVSAFGSDASTIGVFFEKPASGNRTASAGWYNTAAFEQIAHKNGYYAKSINGDAFSKEIKQKTIELIKRDLGKIDLVVYSLASPRRTDPETGEVYNSVIKPFGKPFTSKTVDFHTAEVSEITIDPATEEEARQTVAVMGGYDWKLWMEELKNHDALANNAMTVAYSYVGPELTHAIYRNGTIGLAKNHLEKTSRELTEYLSDIGGKAYVSVNKALVTQASSAIPVVSLYISLLYKVMKQKGIHEGCIEQMYRLFKDRLYADSIPLDTEGRICIDDLEMRSDVQQEVSDLWEIVNTSNIKEISDIQGFRTEFFRLFGFAYDEVNYSKDVEIDVKIPSID